MDKIDINEIIKAAVGALDLSRFNGDVVMYKHVDKEMNVAEGGIGEQHIHYHYDIENGTGNNGSADTPESETEKPLCVAIRSNQRQILDAAESAGIIVYNRDRQGYDKGQFASHSLVAYLCGRLFCGDYSEDGVWKEGSRFDDAQYCQHLFGFDVAGTRRKVRGSGAGKSPIGFEKIDTLFNKIIKKEP